MLTQKQKDLLLLIDRKIKAVGVPPSYDEMKDALGLASKSGIHRLITCLLYTSPSPRDKRQSRMPSSA